MIRFRLYRALESALHLRNRMLGIGVFPDPSRQFGPEGPAEAVSYCDRVNRDFPAYLKPPADCPPLEFERRAVPGPQGLTTEELTFASPRPSGHPRNDRVQLRVWRRRGGPVPDRVVVFHHPLYQSSWRPWEWFLRDLIERVPVAFMAGPYHFDRTPPGWFPGESVIGPNPARVYRAMRQWVADQRAAHVALEQYAGLRPVAVVGFSLGAFQSLLAASIGELSLPIVSIGCTNRYFYGLTRGTLGGPVIDATRRAGVTLELLSRMADSLQLERHVPRIQDQPVLMLRGVDDRVDPPPSGERLQRALRPTRAVMVPAGHATLLFHRRSIFRESLRFFDELGLLDPEREPAARAGRLEASGEA